LFLEVSTQLGTSPILILYLILGIPFWSLLERSQSPKVLSLDTETIFCSLNLQKQVRMTLPMCASMINLGFLNSLGVKHMICPVSTDNSIWVLWQTTEYMTGGF
jgi:hypothetical protein